MQSGMLTLKVGAKTKKLVAWPRGRKARYGRWETRMRAVELGKTGRQFQFNWELSPANGSMCEGNKIVMAAYTPGDRSVRGTVRTRPTNAFNFTKPLDLRSRAWHTYAVEVTRDHISWFVDTKVIHTERRPKALAGVATGRSSSSRASRTSGCVSPGCRWTGCVTTHSSGRTRSPSRRRP